MKVTRDTSTQLAYKSVVAQLNKDIYIRFEMPEFLKFHLFQKLKNTLILNDYLSGIPAKDMRV
jgi:hypothetical protein